jgi:hypothetical protein
MMKALAPVVLVFASVIGVFAADPAPRPAVVLDHTEKMIFDATAKTGRRYELLISLPADYATSGRKYPVLYILDGWHFPLLAFLQNNNPYSERMRPVIMVNISHGTAANPMPLRAQDFTPTHLDLEPTSGGAAAFLDALEHDLIPFIDRTYRTDPGDRALLGHSYGGLFALYALTQRPALFGRIVAASPVVGWDRRLLFTAARERLKSLPKPVRLDLSAGDEARVGDFNITADTAAFEALLAELKVPNLEHRYTYFPGENHNSIRPVSFPHALYWVYRP